MTTRTTRSATRTGVRERKHDATRQRIAETALALFLAHGYTGTTLDAIAAGAGISRRTFFSYFNSKDEIILAWQTAEWNAVLAELRNVSPDEAPLDAVRKTLMTHISQYQSEQMRTLDQVMRSSETLLSRKAATYALQEETLYALLCEVWRQPYRQPALRSVAMIAVGAMRLAIDAWSKQTDQRSPAEYLEDAFDHLKREIRTLSAGE